MGVHDHTAPIGVLTIHCPLARIAAKNDCPECPTSSEGAVGVNSISINTVRLTLKNNLTLTDDQRIWLHDDTNIEEVGTIYNFLMHNRNIDNFNEFTPEAINFAELAIEALDNNGIDDGEVDFDNKVILDSTVINNQKVKCVYDKLKSLSNTVFSDIINDHFDSAKKSHVRFKIKTPPNGGDAFTKGFTNNGKSFFEIQLDPTVVSNASTIEIALMLIHESIHAELLDRCAQLGIINAFNSDGDPNFTNTSLTYSTYDTLFALLVYQYKNYYVTNPLPSGDSPWNHDLFTVLNYRTKMAQNLVNIHPWLNDINNDFLTNVNNDSLNLYGNFTLEQLMEYISWIGLEGTQEFINTIQNNPLEQTKKNYVENSARLHYTNNCN